MTSTRPSGSKAGCALPDPRNGNEVRPHANPPRRQRGSCTVVATDLAATHPCRVLPSQNPRSLSKSLSENWEGSCFQANGAMARREEGAYPQWSVTDEQRSQRAVCLETLRAAVLLAVSCVGSTLTAHFGDAPASPPWPPPKSLAAGPLPVSGQALRLRGSATSREGPFRWNRPPRRDFASVCPSLRNPSRPRLFRE